MAKKKTKLQLVQDQVEQVILQTNLKIEELGEHASVLFEKLDEIQVLFDAIRNVPHEQKLQYEKLKPIRLNYKYQVEKIEVDHKNAVAKNAGKGAAGVGVGTAAVALGPTAAMGVATTFGVASTGTAISALSGAAATNAALAWLGGGALAVGGGGMAAGEIFLAMFGPIGWTIAGVALLGSGLSLLKGHSEKNRLEKIWLLISKRDFKSYSLALVELNERIANIADGNQGLETAIERIKSFGLDYSIMTEEQQYELGSYVNLMNITTQLLVNPVLGLLPKYTDEKLELFLSENQKYQASVAKESIRAFVVSLACLLYKIELDPKDRKLFWKSLRGNNKLLEASLVSKKEFSFEIMEIVEKALRDDCLHGNKGADRE